jgi:hypothetical protein
VAVCCRAELIGALAAPQQMRRSEKVSPVAGKYPARFLAVGHVQCRREPP